MPKASSQNKSTANVHCPSLIIEKDGESSVEHNIFMTQGSSVGPHQSELCPVTSAFDHITLNSQQILVGHSRAGSLKPVQRFFDSSSLLC
mmetsp:Transcript_34927/g.104186  ORF Transcript_34927/g.104186 Transcript_34927/m.104186 type:complete len:90 (-) Transcript_34927:336-605(-)